MKVDIVSDLHVEFNHSYFYKQLIKTTEARKIIIAGDMGPVSIPEVQLAFRRLAAGYEEVIYVPGNHDYYGGTIHQGNVILQGLEDELPNLTVLGVGKMTTIGDIKVVGATLWVPPLINILQQNPINDPFQIPGLYFELPILNSNARKFFDEVVDENTIMITHHQPHPACIAPQYANEPANCWFLSDESELIAKKKPYMCIYGHTHVRNDFMIDSTRFINQAHGYPQEYKAFNKITYEL